MTSANAEASTIRTGALTADDVVQAATAIVLASGVSALTMRRLSESLGVAVTSIYWHVGNRDALLTLIVDRLLAELEAVKPRGRTPRDRIVSLVRDWRGALLSRPHLVGLAHQQHRSSVMMQPMSLAIATELASLDIRGVRAAALIRQLQVHVAASLLLERNAAYDPESEPLSWPSVEDSELVEALTGPPDYEAVFNAGLDAILASL